MFSPISQIAQIQLFETNHPRSQTKSRQVMYKYLEHYCTKHTVPLLQHNVDFIKRNSTNIGLNMNLNLEN